MNVAREMSVLLDGIKKTGKDCPPGQHVCPETGKCVPIGSGGGKGPRSKLEDLAPMYQLVYPRHFQELSEGRALAASVRVFLMILSHKIIAYDKRMQRKQYNIYRLGLLLDATNKVDTRCTKIMDNADEESMKKLKKAIGHEFESDFPPAKAVLKKIDRYLKDGKPPTLR